MTAFTEVSVSAGGAKTVRAAVTYSMPTFNNIVGRTVTEVTFAGRTFSMLTCLASVVTAFHSVMVILVFTCTNIVFTARKGMVFPTLAEIIVTMLASNMFSFVAGIVATF